MTQDREKIEYIIGQFIKKLDQLLTQIFDRKFYNMTIVIDPVKSGIHIISDIPNDDITTSVLKDITEEIEQRINVENNVRTGNA